MEEEGHCEKARRIRKEQQTLGAIKDKVIQQYASRWKVGGMEVGKKTTAIDAV